MRLRLLCLAALLLEAVQLPLYAAAFGGALTGLVAVRALLTLALAAVTWRGHTIARVVLGAVRLMAMFVGAVMATLMESRGLALALGGACILDGAVGIMLLWRRGSGVAAPEA
jgi:hypothetical protein